MGKIGVNLLRGFQITALKLFGAEESKGQRFPLTMGRHGQRALVSSGEMASLPDIPLGGWSRERMADKGDCGGHRTGESPCQTPRLCVEPEQEMKSTSNDTPWHSGSTCCFPGAAH